MAQPFINDQPAPQMNAIPNANPLSKHFRQPMLYIKLVSEGKFWKDGALDLPLTGDIPVYPMSAKDEIILRTPDGLINGTSVVQILQSCCPNIKNAWDMPSIDVDSTLIAIRIASYGSSMSVGAKCPKCKAEHDYDIDLEYVRNQIHQPDYSKPVVTNDGLEIYLRPLNYAQVSKTGTIAFEEDRMINSLADPNIDETVRSTKFAEHIQKMIALNNESISDCTDYIIADGAKVADRKFISEYFQNAGSNVTRMIQDRLKEYGNSVSIKPIPTKCSECEAEFNLTVDFDYSRFFGQGF